ncbi:MAG TPA: SUMF1/EgtB/PvdO family nonheme iron enzyme [Polyangiaceae bacterium]|nr:SUMF1/EgtB/PvdO family nonheme iron enzyme [Polyangiaceae bacterium]
MPKDARLLVAAAALLAAIPACRQRAAGGGEAAARGAPSAEPSAAVTEPLAGERVEVPAGSFHAGSLPGEPGRHPDVEQRRSDVELGPFRVDRLPYPNDPHSPPRVGVTRDEATRLCEARDERLCTELEWERVCKGPASHLFPSGDTWNAACASGPLGCAAGFDVLALGTLREWTASDVAFENGSRKAAVRGASAKADAAAHRCAARGAENPDAKSDDLGFRCCKGPKNAAVVQEPHAGQTFAQASITPARLAELFKVDEKTAPLSKDLRFFKEPDSAETVVARGPGDRKGFLFTVAPLLWNPVPGAEFLVVTGRAGESTSFIAAFHVMGKDDYKLASSFIMENEVGPVALAYNGYIRPRIHWSTCWGCPGESGRILYRDPDEAVIVQP